MVLCRKAETDPTSAWAAKPCSARLESQVELMELSLGHLQVCCLLSPWVFLLVLGGQALSRGMSLGLVELFPQQGGHSILSRCSPLFCSDLCCISWWGGGLLLPQGEALPMCCSAHGSLCLWVFVSAVLLPPGVSLCLQGINFLFCVPGTQQVPLLPLCSSLSLLVCFRA